MSQANPTVVWFGLVQVLHCRVLSPEVVTVPEIQRGTRVGAQSFLGALFVVDC